ncbi:2OG-Fe(II) oxygenase [Novosphingobium sp. 1949]|uniref:2OG-Fe(II) oxygenase n=1 Tax=Novosphingobium organovorum TaxID=2930092 RepID=A0ABT0BFX4_9SPHN|nr:2OG-Fe(II) oxygenase family protein [Novosphingobium organovorum]MCJ2183939.1 2OG-Fe(II) oxygenase [Novosphingobium organovorum]
MTLTLFQINPALDRAALRETFLRDSRVQVRDFLTAEAAANVRHVLERETPWGLAYQAGDKGHRTLRPQDLAALSPADRSAIAGDVEAAAARGEYAVRFNSYPMLDAYLQGWGRDGPQGLLLEHINDQPFLDLARDICAIPELIKADAQATLFAGGDFLGPHTDAHVGQGWRVAYVMNFAQPEWHPDWGGYLNFLDDEGDVVAGWRPRFNALNLLLVPQRHMVSYVPPFAPARRLAITGWLRDR